MGTRTGVERVAAGLAVVVAMAACAGDVPEASEAVGAEVGAAAPALAAVGAWVRTAVVPEGAGEPGAPPVNSAAYLVIRNPGPAADALVAVETAAADTAELHSVSMADGVMRMRPVDSVAVGAGGEAVLEPGGFHVMLIGLRAALAEGDTVPLTLRFRSGRTLEVTAPVRRSPPE